MAQLLAAIMAKAKIKAAVMTRLSCAIADMNV